MRNYDSIKKTNNISGELEKSAAKQVKERYRKSLEEQIENDRRIKQLKQDMTVHEEKMNSNEVKVIKRFKLDSSVAAFLKDSPLYIPTVRQSPESKPQGMIRTFKSKLPPSFIGSKMIQSVLPPDFVGMISDRKSSKTVMDDQMNHLIREMNS